MKSRIAVPTKTITFVLGALFLGVTIASFVITLLNRNPDIEIALLEQYGDLLYVDDEGNIPTWLSSLTLALCGQLLLFIGYQKYQQKADFAKHWIGLGLLFFLLSLDEFIQMHEFLIQPMRQLFNITEGPLFFAWVIPGSVFVLVVALIYFPFLRYLAEDTRNVFVLSAVLFVGGAIGMEIMGGYLYEQPVYLLVMHIEELLEMMGITVFVYGLLSYAVADSGDEPGFTKQWNAVDTQPIDQVNLAHAQSVYNRRVTHSAVGDR